MSMPHRTIRSEDAPTLAHLFAERCSRTPHQPAYIQYVDGDWKEFLWLETADAAARWQEAMQAEGLRRGDRVAIMCGNRCEWVQCDLAAQGLGLVTVPIYSNDQAGNVAWILRDCGARLLVVEHARQWFAIDGLGEALPDLVRVVSIGPTGSPVRGLLQSLGQWLPDGSPQYRCDPGAPDTLATIVYTSGTTGRPKGVMLSHRNILSNVQGALQMFDVFQHDLLLSFLPLSHTFERTVGYYLPMATGTPVAYNRSIQQLADDLVAIQPTIMISVPRIFERVYAVIMEGLGAKPRWARRLFEMAVDTGWDHFQFEQGRGTWQGGFLLRPLLNALIGHKVRQRLGGRLRFTVCGGAALSPEVSRLFIGLGIPIVQGYGLTETSPIISANPLANNRPDSVGIPLPDVEVKIGDDDELLARGPGVMLGYWNNPAATTRTIDADGWLHTGDKAAIASDGHLYITGRIKEIIVLSSGEKVPPNDVETAIALDELVDQVMLIGEGRPYLTALVVPNPDAIRRVAEDLHLDPANEDVCCDKKVRALFLKHVHERTRRFPGHTKVRRLAVVNEAWTADNGLVTPTLKLRRQRILARYRDVAEKLYAGH